MIKPRKRKSLLERRKRIPKAIKMKLHLSTFFLCITILATGQSVPQGIPFQGVARDLEGHPIGNKEIDIRIHLLQEQTTGSLLYVEYHQITTNNLGLFQLVVGQGRATEADFSTVPWSRSDIWLELAIRETGSSTGYEVLSSSQLLSVPYAMHAGSADMMTTDDQNSLLGPFWKTTGNSGSLPQFHFIGTVDAKDLNFRTANQHRLKIKADGNIEILMSLDVAHDLVVNGNSIIEGNLNVNGVLYGDGSGLTNINVNDADADPTNELQNWNNLPGIPPNIDTDATDDFSGNYNDLSNRPSIPSKTSDLLNDSGYITSAADADADPMNELEMPSNVLPGDMAYFNGSNWQSIPQGLDGQVLTLSAGVPTWADLPSGPGNGTFSCGDQLNYEGQSYATVQIGNQCWMAENLNIGVRINGSSNQANNGIIEKYCYGNNESNCASYGGLYQWNEMMQYETLEESQGICPTGWHIPTNAEWTTLTNTIPSNDRASRLAGNIDLWTADNALTQSPFFGTSGFSGTPGGCRLTSSYFDRLGLSAYYWSSTPISSDAAWRRYLLIYNSSSVNPSTSPKTNGFSVRCVKD